MIHLLLLLLGASLCVCHYSPPPHQYAALQSSNKQPVIIDTDVGSYLDDTFAIVYAALSQHLDIKLIVTCTDDTTARAKVVAKLLRIMGRDDIPIGIGMENENQTHHYLFDWGKDEDLSQYKGGVYQDGVKKMAEVLTDSDQAVDVIAIGPMTNFPELVHKYPDCVKNARIRAMAGSIYVDYDGNKRPVAEYNVAICPWCMEVLLKSGWNVTMTPLDSCETVILGSNQLKLVADANSKASLALTSSLTSYCLAMIQAPRDRCDFEVGTPALYDVVATLLALPAVAEQFLDYSTMQLSVNGSGFTVIDKTHGVSTSVALTWKQQAEKSFTDTLAKLYSS